jgi:hypothetical protein
LSGEQRSLERQVMLGGNVITEDRGHGRREPGRFCALCERLQLVQRKAAQGRAASAFSVPVSDEGSVIEFIHDFL